MTSNPRSLSAYFRTLLVLGRVSNLPTVWSNCLAGWILGGGGPWPGLIWICAAATCLYISGMYLNDAFDAQFDRSHRQERPIPSGAIAEREVWTLGVGWLLAGLGLLALGSTGTFMLGFILTLAILLYDAVHKRITFSPVLMAACRFFLYLMAASAADRGVGGLTVWSALALALYIIGLSYIARKESLPGPLGYWPVILLVSPILLAVIINQGTYLQRAGVAALILGAWIFICLRHIYWTPRKNVGRTVSGLLAGMVWVDLLALAGSPSLEIAAVFALFFGMALLAQRFIPAT